MVASTDWDKAYDSQGSVWGDRPGELAVFAGDFLTRANGDPSTLEIADLGCGYGRDAFYLASRLGCAVTGIDSSAKAISLANQSRPEELKNRVSFICADLAGLDRTFPVIFAANLYQVLRLGERARLAATVIERLSPGGLLFLGTLSTRDPEEYGKGRPVSGEDDSFESEKFLHFATRSELERLFSPLAILELCERRYLEPHPGGRTHDHIAWMLAARKPL
jgi:SAM-dependent methyltransferase